MAHRHAISIACAALCLPWSAGAGSDPSDVLQQTTAKQIERNSRLPNYTCVQTVTRDFYKPRGATLPRACAVLMELRQHPTFDMELRPAFTDRLRLDVAMTRRGEIFSWAGAGRFEDLEIDQLVREGPFGTGSFGGLLAMLFREHAPPFRFVGERVVEGRRLLEYSYQIPRQESHYQVKADESWVAVAYRGTFLVDPQAGDVVRMSANCGELPESSGSCQTMTDLDFHVARIGEGEFLLPIRVRQRYVSITGEEAENTTTYSACREYRADSQVTFAPAPEAPDTGVKAKPITTIPAGLPFTLELTSPIAPDTAAAGDRFTARLVRSLRWDGKTLARANAVIEGRILRVEQLHTGPARSIVVLKPRTIEIHGVPTPFSVVHNWASEPLKKGERRRILLPRPWERDAGAFEIPGEHAVLPAGSRSNWRTAR